MTDTADIFETGDIFADRQLVRVGHVPELGRVVGRDAEIEAVGGALAPGIRGGPPETTIIYGKTGTGKSLVARCVTREATRQAATNAGSNDAGARSASTARMQSPAGVSQSSVVTSSVLPCSARTFSWPRARTTWV